MKRSIAAFCAAILLGVTPSPAYHIELTHYYASPADEHAHRNALIAQARAFITLAAPENPAQLDSYLQRYDSMLKRLERHDIYVYLRSEEDDRDTADATADDTLTQLEDTLKGRLEDVAHQLGKTRIAAWTGTADLRPYRYLLEDALATAAHRLRAGDRRAIELAVQPVLDTAAASYKALRKQSAPTAGNQDAYAALLVAIVSANDGIARLRGFSGASEASYFDKGLTPASVGRTLEAVRGSNAFARYLTVAALAPKPAYSPPPIAISDAIPVVLAAEQPMGATYAQAYADLLGAMNGRLEICTEAHCDRSGFSLGFAGVDSAAFFGRYDGSTDSIRAVSHESGHAVHREFMNLHQPIAAYNEGPHFMFESFAIFNELLFLDHLYKTADGPRQRAYFLNAFLDDATFQIYGSAEETDLEAAIYRGVKDGSLKTAADFDALTAKTFATYDPGAAAKPDTQLYWARNRLFYTDPLYDVNYLYAGLLALRYYTAFERDPQTFSARYVALLSNGFNESPAALERKFLGIDLDDEAGLTKNAAAFINGRTAILAKLYP